MLATHTKSDINVSGRRCTGSHAVSLCHICQTQSRSADDKMIVSDMTFHADDLFGNVSYQIQHTASLASPVLSGSSSFASFFK